MILDRRPPAATPIQDHQAWPKEAAMHYRCLACPGPGQTKPGQDAPWAGRPGDARPRLPLTRRGGATTTVHRARTLSGPVRLAVRLGIAYLALLATMPLTGVAGLAGLLPSTARCRGLVRQLFLENERATVMPPLRQRTLDGRAEAARLTPARPAGHRRRRAHHKALPSRPRGRLVPRPPSQTSPGLHRRRSGNMTTSLPPPT